MLTNNVISFEQPDPDLDLHCLLSYIYSMFGMNECITGVSFKSHAEINYWKKKCLLDRNEFWELLQFHYKQNICSMKQTSIWRGDALCHKKGLK